MAILAVNNAIEHGAKNEADLRRMQAQIDLARTKLSTAVNMDDIILSNPNKLNPLEKKLYEIAEKTKVTVNNEEMSYGAALRKEANLREEARRNNTPSTTLVTKMFMPTTRS